MNIRSTTRTKCTCFANIVKSTVNLIVNTTWNIDSVESDIQYLVTMQHLVLVSSEIESQRAKIVTKTGVCNSVTRWDRILFFACFCCFFIYQGFQVWFGKSGILFCPGTSRQEVLMGHQWWLIILKTFLYSLQYWHSLDTMVCPEIPKRMISSKLGLHFVHFYTSI